MLSKFLQILDGLASSYWFVPSVMAALAFLAALNLTQADWALAAGASRWLGFFPDVGPEGARTVMATVAGSMITVAGVTFSITISTIVHATSQFGPRLLTNFMQDRGNQFTLGTFIATFLYCLVVLSQIQGDEGGAAEGVPLLAISVGLSLAVASVLVLIYFVHHVPASIHASFVIASVGRQLIDRVTSLYDRSGDEEPEQDSDCAEAGDDNVHHVRSTFSGYIQFLDYDGLIDLACEHDCVLHLNVGPGDYVNAGDYLLWLCCEEQPDEALQARLCEMFLYGDRRTPAQDALFLANELVEIATRALSPGINDPFTAMMCTDWLGSACAAIAGRAGKQRYRHDAQRNLRVVTPAATAEDFIRGSIEKLMPYASRDRNAALHLQALLAKLILTIDSARTVELLRGLHGELVERAQDHLAQPDLETLSLRRSQLEEALGSDAQKRALYRSAQWVTRSA